MPQRPKLRRYALPGLAAHDDCVFCLPHITAIAPANVPPPTKVLPLTDALPLIDILPLTGISLTGVRAGYGRGTFRNASEEGEIGFQGRPGEGAAETDAEGGGGCDY